MATFKHTQGVGVYHERLVGGMVRRGYDPELAERVFKQIEGFGSYGFPESHAASFAHLAYASSWLKCHHPAVVARTAAGDHTIFMSFGHRGLAQAKGFHELLAKRWLEGSGDPATMKLGVQRYIFVTEDPSEAQHAATCVRNLARAAVNLNSENPSKDGSFLRLMPLNDEPPLDDFLDNAVIGSPNLCAEKLHEEIEALRPSHLSCFMGFAGIGRKQTLTSMERFGCEVLPQLGRLVTMHEAA
jgi:alkanesulfonate monooxygenase SsuD/methylene tetrahydromethanopterin reductase-like flavin-dependent oxidoreductase (luciferase family)